MQFPRLLAVVSLVTLALATPATSGDNLGTVTCSGAENSEFPLGAGLALKGSASVAANDIEIVLHSIPSREFARLVLGRSGPTLPYGNGNLCIDTGPGLVRLMTMRANSGGRVRGPLDMNAWILPALLQPGTTWTFQVMYRDPQAGNARFNLTNGVEVTFES